MTHLLLAVFGAALGGVLATLGEYWIHRGMHNKMMLSKRHADHHRQGEGQGVLWEFFDYSIGSLVGVGALAGADYVWLTGGWFFGGALLGVVAHAIFAAWAHQAQHEDARLCPWMTMPVHFVHHKLGQSRHNFGISVDWWDKAFGTYQYDPRWRRFVDETAPRRAFWQVDWRDNRRPAS